MAQEKCISAGDKYFGAIEREDYDINAAMKDPDIDIGRSGHGIIRIGLFGGKQTTTNPESITASEKDGRGARFVRAVARAIQNIQDYPGTVHFPREIENTIYSKSRMSDPFGAYRFTVWLGDYDNRAHRPIVEGLVDYFETEHEGRNDIRAVEFSFDTMDAAEKFRTVYPWAKRETELQRDNHENLDAYVAPRPIRKLASELRNHPINCKDAKPLTITVHYYNPRQDRDGRHDREFSMEDFYGSSEMHIINKDRRTPVEKALGNASTNHQNTMLSYEIRISVETDDVAALIENESERQLTSTEDVVRELGRTHHENTYGTMRPLTVGIVKLDETDEFVDCLLTITARQ